MLMFLYHIYFFFLLDMFFPNLILILIPILIHVFFLVDVLALNLVLYLLVLVLVLLLLSIIFLPRVLREAVHQPP